MSALASSSHRSRMPTGISLACFNPPDRFGRKLTLRRDARGSAAAVVPLEEQNRCAWHAAQIDEGLQLVEKSCSQAAKVRAPQRPPPAFPGFIKPSALPASNSSTLSGPAQYPVHSC